MFPNSNFDDWKWATEQSCIYNEIISYKIPTLDKQTVITMTYWSVLGLKTSYIFFLQILAKWKTKWMKMKNKWHSRVTYVCEPKYSCLLLLFAAKQN